MAEKYSSSDNKKTSTDITSFYLLTSGRLLLTRNYTGIPYVARLFLEIFQDNNIPCMVHFGKNCYFLRDFLLKSHKYISNSKYATLVEWIYQHIITPRNLLRNNNYIYWSWNHKLPFFLPGRAVKILTIHDLVWKKHPETMKFLGYLQEVLIAQHSIESSDIIVVHTHAIENEIAIHFPEHKSKIRVVPLCVRKFHEIDNCVEDRKHAMLPTFYFLSVGTIEPRKNLIRLLHAYRRLPELLRTKFKLIIAGGKGWGNINLEDVVTQLGLETDVILFGYATDKELFDLYKHAFCLTMPSLYEGFGMPILEAQSFGVPVITSNISSMPEVAGDGAILVDPYSVEDIQRGLERLTADGSMRAILSRKAKINSGKYNPDRTKQLALDVFREATELRTSKQQ